MTNSDQLQNFENYMAIAAGLAISLPMSAMALEKLVVFGHNRYDSLRQRHETHRYRKADSIAATDDQLIDSDLPLIPVIEFIGRRRSRVATVEQVAARKAKLKQLAKQNGGGFYYDSTTIDAPFVDLSRLLRQVDNLPEKAMSAAREMEEDERLYPDTNGFPHQSIDILIGSLGVRRAALMLSPIVDPRIVVARDAADSTT